ncbi:MAG: hypothetical protein DRH26_00720 [Deltaproteobacteria bacterium]|nr:MAG: hypothetical protein DRH26_00720 [Deltaproteobacteria bacterium]
MIHTAHTQHLFMGTMETKKPANTWFAGSMMVEAAGVEPAPCHPKPRQSSVSNATQHIPSTFLAKIWQKITKNKIFLGVEPSG